MEAIKSKIGKTVTIIFLVIALLIGSVGYIAWYNLFREVPVYYESPEEHFKYGSIGTEASEGIPYWIWLVLPRLFPEKLPKPGGYTSLGFTWEKGQETPIGISKMTIGFPRQGITCAVCHTSTVRETPKDKPLIFLGGPSSKFDSQSYLRFLAACANDPRFTPDYILSEINYVYNLSWFDKLLYRYVIIPQTKKGILRQAAGLAWMDSRPDWGAGRISPFNPGKFRYLEQPLDDTVDNSDMMSIWNQKIKVESGFAYHWDGLETSLVETIQTGAIGDGASPKSINIEGLKRVEEFITELPPPKYPFALNTELVVKGSKIFNNNCASCHAFGGKKTGTVIPVEEIGTDRHRLDMWTQAAADSYNQYAEDYEWDFDYLRKTNGYVAVSLDGLWLRAPYLHNGSVPSLQDLLEKPENRPQVFYRGYDVYNQEKVGFVAEGAEAQKVGFKYDTSLVANGNQGHLYGTDLPGDEKTALIEYLKTL
ncbi:c-type cytochrome [Limnofasciculus baicalensis]|uniref:C-type cytochrome n=1 Tax=Limnofasciculus baicalensis BBK-W-15 TaxID=2699891 RepID=A0AAE3GWD8_9CYAN|nr:c-type cytochrome [Limnofasciculus baicalensis]MCP2731121.1 c-type cytochrome [Limnofasciculus baicalensis BBK-W-15]